VSVGGERVGGQGLAKVTAAKAASDAGTASLLTRLPLRACWLPAGLVRPRGSARHAISNAAGGAGVMPVRRRNGLQTGRQHEGWAVGGESCNSFLSSFASPPTSSAPRASAVIDKARADRLCVSLRTLRRGIRACHTPGEATIPSAFLSCPACCMLLLDSCLLSPLVSAEERGVVEPQFASAAHPALAPRLAHVPEGHDGQQECVPLVARHGLAS
jgi:hypothetical protein